MEMAHLSPLSFCESSKKSVSLVSLPWSFHSSLFSSQLSFCPPNLSVAARPGGDFSWHTRSSSSISSACMAGQPCMGTANYCSTENWESWTLDVKLHIRCSFSQESPQTGALLSECLISFICSKKYPGVILVKPPCKLLPFLKLQGMNP